MGYTALAREECVPNFYIHIGLNPKPSPKGLGFFLESIFYKRDKGLAVAFGGWLV